MMEYSIDLTRRGKKSPGRIIFGVVAIVFAILNITDEVFFNEEMEIMDWFSFSIYTFLGIYWIADGLGKSFEGFFGKAFIQINEDAIAIKPKICKKEQCLEWGIITSVEYRPQNFIFSRIDGSQYSIHIGEFEYEIIKEIKDSIAEIGKSKGIPVALK